MCKIFDNMYEWALNAYDIPFVSYVGENDRSHVKHKAAEQLVRDGIQFEGDPLQPQGHERAFDHVSGRAEYRSRYAPGEPEAVNAFLYDRIKMGRQIPDHIRFMTYTTTV